jgi:hypothetical protein
LSMGCSPSLSGQRGQPCRELSSWTAGSPALWRAPACSTRATTGQGCRRGSLGWCPEPGAPRRRRRSRRRRRTKLCPHFEDKILMKRTKPRSRWGQKTPSFMGPLVLNFRNPRIFEDQRRRASPLNGHRPTAPAECPLPLRVSASSLLTLCLPFGGTLREHFFDSMIIPDIF